MKIALFGITEIKTGRHNLKDPRFDETDRLVEADKKTYAQVEVVDDTQLLDSDAILASTDARLDLILKDLEFVETRLGRDPQPAEREALMKIQAALEAEKFVSQAELTPAELGAITVHSFHTYIPVTVAPAGDLAAPDGVLLRAFAEAGWICFLTVGGKENRAWPIRRGTTAVDAAGSIHTDMQKGFIRAEIIGYDDFIAAGGETQAKRAGKQRLETKQYVMQDHDLTNFRFNK